MGDRANVILRARGEQVCLYTHWGGSELHGTVRAALKRGEGRWEDFPYLARIIFCQMVAGHEMETTGFGISQLPCEASYKDLTIDVDRGIVSTKGSEPMSFAAFIRSAN